MLDRLGKAILVLFRFEKRWYDSRGLGAKVTWVGHPLVDRAREELATPAGARTRRHRVVLMPGSRSGEIRRNLPVMRDAAVLLSASRGDVEFVLVQADSVADAALRDSAGAALDSWRIVSGPHLALLAASDVLVVASGTATVEGLLARIPMVVIYRMNRLTHFIARRLVRGVRHIAMANIVSDDGSGARAVPELIQDEATGERIAHEVAAFLDDPARAEAARRALGRGLEDLGPPGAPERTARALLLALGRGEP
jgi:lipid-A-disaccharide synthase